MPGDRQPVSAREVLAALAEIKRRGHWPLFQRLEHLEPDLTEFILEEVTLVHQTLLKSAAPPKVVRRLQRQIQSIVLVAWLCLRAEPGDETTSPNTTKEDL